MKEGEDIQLVLDVLVRGAKGMVEEGVTNDPWHYENVSESIGEGKAGNAWAENRPETTLKNIDNVKMEDKKKISCKNRTAEWLGGTLQQESRNNSSQETESHRTQYAPTETNEKYAGYNTDLNRNNGDLDGKTTVDRSSVLVEVKKISQEKQDIPVQREAINARTGIKNPASIPENVHHSTLVKEYIPVGNQENGDSDGKTAEYRSSVLAEVNRMSQEKRSIPKKEKDEKHQAGIKNPTEDPKNIIHKMKVSVKGVEIRDMRSYLAKKKKEREQNGKKFGNKEDNQVPEHRSHHNHGDQHRDTHSNKPLATGGKSEYVPQNNGNSDAKEGKKNIFKNFWEPEKKYKNI